LPGGVSRNLGGYVAPAFDEQSTVIASAGCRNRDDGVGSLVCWYSERFEFDIDRPTWRKALAQRLDGVLD
jgi:hypothetical protein